LDAGDQHDIDDIERTILFISHQRPPIGGEDGKVMVENLHLPALGQMNNKRPKWLLDEQLSQFLGPHGTCSLGGNRPTIVRLLLFSPMLPRAAKPRTDIT
jgi:hypothetical protein